MKSAFTVLELLLALAVVALIMAAIGPAVIGSLRALEDWREVVEALREEALCFDILRDDLLACQRATGSHDLAFTLDDDGLSFTSAALPDIHPRIASREPRGDARHIHWQIVDDDDGLRLCRSSDPNVFASAVLPEAASETLLGNLAVCRISCFVGKRAYESYDSDSQDGSLPTAVEIRFAFRREDGEAGPERVRHIALPQVLLDPLQIQDGG